MNHSIDDIIKEGDDLLKQFLSEGSSIEETAIGMGMVTHEFLTKQVQKKFPGKPDNAVRVALLIAYCALCGQQLCECMVLAKPDHRDALKDMFLKEMDKMLMVVDRATEEASKHL